MRKTATRGVPMANGPGHFLNELTIWKLKAVANEFGIDVTSCKYKRDYVQKISARKLTEEQVRSVLDKIKRDSDKASREAPRKDIGKELEAIADAPLQAPELPAGEEKNVERNIDEALMMKPALFEADSAAETALNRMILGDYYNAIKMIREARGKCLENFSRFQVYSSAMSIRSADELFSKLASDRKELDPILRTALAEAKLAFLDGPPKRREETIENLEILSTKAFDAYMANTEKEEAELKGLLADYESFGTRTEESRRYLEIAGQARQAMNISEYGTLIESAKNQAAKSKEQRVREIANSFHIVRAGTAEAKDIGVDTSSAEKGFAEAKKAFEEGSFKTAVSLLADIERQVDEAHLKKLKARKDLEEAQLNSVRRSIESYEPMFKEAASYGMDVKDGTYNIVNARAALARNDVINGVKFGRRIRDIGDSLEKNLDSKRIELGVVKRLEGVKCESCGKKSVYIYPDSAQKCVGCGHVQSHEVPVSAKVDETSKAAAPSASAVERKAVLEAQSPQQEGKKRKFGFFRW
jgi:hypothetical protein